MISLVFALVRYIVHDVYKMVPFLLPDSLEAINSERITALIVYFGSYISYFVVALLNEDVQVIDEDHSLVTNI